jgi:hypothetical protein
LKFNEKIVVAGRIANFGARSQREDQWQYRGAVRHANEEHPNATQRTVRLVRPLPENVIPMRQSVPVRLRSQWPSLSVQALVIVAVGLIAVDFRWCVWLLALAIAWAFVLRLALPQRRIGWLEVRRRRTDLVCLGALLLGFVLVAVATPRTI